MRTIDTGALAHKVRRLAHLDIPGAGQVTVAGHHAYVGHIPNKDRLGTTIIDVADPASSARRRNHHARRSGLAQPQGPRRRRRDDRQSRTQHEPHRAARRATAGRARGTCRTVAARTDRGRDRRQDGRQRSRFARLEAAGAQRYENGGFKVYDVVRPAKPRLIAYQKTGGIGVHRFAMDARYAYISTEMDGFIGNILVVYDIADPRAPREVSRWWMPGQHIAGGETPTWSGRRHRLHHALRFGDELWASCWHGGFWMIDCSDIARPRSARLVQLSSAVSRADPHGDAGCRRASTGGASRSRSTRKTRRRAQARSRRGAGARMPGLRPST